MTKHCFRGLDYHINTTGTNQNPTAPFSSIFKTLGTLTLSFKDFTTYSKDNFMVRKMLVYNFRFFLLNVLIWSIFMPGIKIRTFLSSTDPGVFQNLQLTDLINNFFMCLVGIGMTEFLKANQYHYSLGYLKGIII